MHAYSCKWIGTFIKYLKGNKFNEAHTPEVPKDSY